ncbi:MAG: hypothetical protein F6K36_29740 [Symploca sp. SIO3C6]|uniref:Transposase IS200-like domain-containing protein n=1 Tax=Symploca sp. SIO1C4 TaxID=2607765 RepID=A0A6B3NPT6_9CYAN|nr:hypothetical protein [Symploca sp. SIO3C6]NER31521.1 hypothetical protein [Symploca sp. SIO1C4]NET06858.1 hypothetical protein [Symploca sp. SIO2B6]
MRRLKRYYWKPFFWSKAYAVISVGGRAPLAKLVEYISSQDKLPNAVSVALIYCC